MYWALASCAEQISKSEAIRSLENRNIYTLLSRQCLFGSG
jgi:hypothetical protein